MTDFEIVPMEPRHVDAVAALELQCFSDPWPREAIASELENPLSLWLVAEKDGAVIGYVGSQTVPDEADMMNLAVSPAARRQGVASALVRELVTRLQSKGVISLTLEVRASNGPAVRLYDGFGFMQVGRRKNYYFHPTEDALILKKEWKL